MKIKLIALWVVVSKNKLQQIVFVVKESREAEKRVSLVPEDVSKLIKKGFGVIIEDQAGIGAGYTNDLYERVGAQICKIPNNSVDCYRLAFKNVSLIVRVKRPNRIREKLENLAIKSGTKMVGSLEVLERNSNHINEYFKAGIDYYSFDQFYFPSNTPMNALKKMGSFAGKLSVEDAIKTVNRIVNKIVIIGYGKAGQAAYVECIRRKLSCTVITSKYDKAELIKSQGGRAIYLSSFLPLDDRQERIKRIIKDADVVITTASSNGILAPILIPNKTLLEMKPHTVIVDLSVPEGGNVEGSKSDTNLILGNSVYVKNVSGYPKAMPIEASIEWSKASYYFINLLLETPELLRRHPS